MRESSYRLRVSSFGLMTILFCHLSQKTYSQNDVEKLLSSLTPGIIPEDLLAKKTIALYQPTFTSKELDAIQQSFERTGVDVVLYYPSDLPFCTRDLQKAFSDYLTKREIKYLLFLNKAENGFEFIFTEFNKNKTMINPGQQKWSMMGSTINEVTLDIYRTALNNQKRINMLISPTPDYDLTLRFIRGTRGEYYAVDLKVDRLAVVKTGNPQQDQELEELLKANYPFEFKVFEAGTEDAEIRQKGFLYLLCVMNTRGKAAKELLEYVKGKGESSITSVSYMDGQMQLKTISAETPVYKYYFKQLENGNLFLGTKWDADIDWKQALINQLKGLKLELRIN